MKKFFTHADPIVPVHHPRVLVETAVQHGARREDLLAGVGITEETLAVPEARISYAQFAVLESNALRLTGDPALGLHFGRNVHLSHMGLLGLAIASSPNAGAALEMALRYYRTLAPAWDLELLVEGALATFNARETISREPHRVFATEALVAAVYGLARQVMSSTRLPISEIRMAYPKPSHHERYTEFFDAPLRFDADVTGADFDAEILQRPVATADPATAKLAEEYCASEQSRSAVVDGLVSQVRRVLHTREAGRPGLEEVARALQTSTRSLRRGLKEMGTSFQELSDEALRVRAESWVRDGALTVEEVAERLGFSDARSFRRAFKRWTGHTPNAARGEPEGR